MIAWRLLWREAKTGDLLTLFLALVLSVATVSGIGLFVDRLQTSFTNQSATLLGADRSVRADEPFASEWYQQAQQQNLQTATTVGFSSMVFGGQGLQLAQVTAASNNYPLRGEYLVDNQLFGTGISSNEGPNVGEVWISSRLASLLSVSLGETVRIGEAEFTVSRYLVRDPGATSSAFAIAPRAVINLDDLAKTEVIIPGSRVRYAFLFSGEPDNLTSFEQWLTPQLGEGQRIRTPIQRGERIGDTVGRAESFLLLAGALAVIMSGVAMALASSRYVKRHLIQFAVMKTIGATPNKIAAIVLLQLAVILVAGILVGSALGYGVQHIISQVLQSLMSIALPAPSLMKLWLGAATAFISLVAFCLPLLIRLIQVTPLAVLQPSAALPPRVAVTYLTGIGGLFTLMVIYTGGWLMPLVMLVGIGITSLVVGLLGRFCFRLLRRAGQNMSTGWQIGLAALPRRMLSNLFQLLVFTLIIMLALILYGVQNNLIADWQRQLPEGTPNHYLFNVLENQKDGIQSYAQDNELAMSEWFPMIRGRVTHLNGTPVAELFDESKDEPELVERELNLTWSTPEREQQNVVAGEFDNIGVSVEQEAANEVGLEIGDEMTVSLGGLDYTLPVTSIRKVDWESMQPNFYLMLPASVLEEFQANFVSSIFLDAESAPPFYRFMANYPTVSMLNIGELLRQVQDIVAQVGQAIQLVLIFILASGALVLSASVRTTLDERLEEGALLRTLGARKQIVRQSMLIEFGVLGGLAGLLGAFGAELALYGVQKFIFNMETSFHGVIWLVGPVAGLVIVTTIGIFAARAVISVPPIRILRAN
ncbi:FtsX-like permease family protein [Maribrevibacterium harenarium]|uniref:FtsX-like permease family protein n=1 Tax=Maribrevibacterium harenarium TaxID=2589817 RepID=A0A501X4X6_9GAMM|nr:FtsX-like permease family protein [Maribrevibacterium harenarium]TPE55524.1 FtsX-like permease family protein [Maribrevibacterium harenarium]